MLSKERNGSIFFTISYFNLLEYAPTTFEIWRHLMGERPASLAGVVKELELLAEHKKVFCRNGFWYLAGQERLLEKRSRGKKIAVAKLKRILFWSGWLNSLPFLRGVFVNGAVALGTAKKDSDWDVLIVTKKKRIWLARFFLIFFLGIFRKRRSGRGGTALVKNRFCLNHFLTEEGLILEKQNQFVAHEEGFSFPFLGGEVYRKFLNLNFGWLKKKRANFSVDEIDPFWLKVPSPKSLWLKEKMELFLEKTGLARVLNALLKRGMIWLIKNNPKTAWPQADIRYSDQALVFIPNPWRDGLEEKARGKIS